MMTQRTARVTDLQATKAKACDDNYLLFPHSYYKVSIQLRTGTERGSVKYQMSATVAVRAKVYNNRAKRQRAETLSAERQLMKLGNGVAVSYLNFAANKHYSDRLRCKDRQQKKQV